MSALADGPQHLRALGRANEVRLYRADLRRKIRDGEVRVADVFREKLDDRIVNMGAYEILTAQRRWGHQRAMRVLRAFHLSEVIPMGRIGLSTRDRIAQMLDGGGAA